MASVLPSPNNVDQQWAAAFCSKNSSSTLAPGHRGSWPVSFSPFSAALAALRRTDSGEQVFLVDLENCSRLNILRNSHIPSCGCLDPRLASCLLGPLRSRWLNPRCEIPSSTYPASRRRHLQVCGCQAYSFQGKYCKRAGQVRDLVFRRSQASRVSGAWTR